MATTRPVWASRRASSTSGKDRKEKRYVGFSTMFIAKGFPKSSSTLHAAFALLFSLTSLPIQLSAAQCSAAQWSEDPHNDPGHLARVRSEEACQGLQKGVWRNGCVCLFVCLLLLLVVVVVVVAETVAAVSSVCVCMVCEGCLRSTKLRAGLTNPL